MRHVCRKSEDESEKTDADSVAEKMIVERADFGRRIKINHFFTM